MFKKKYRLTKQKDFDKIFKTGYSSFDKIMGVKVIRNGLKYNRFGVIVGKKISNKAVIRNKIKRRIRETLKIYNIQKSFDIIIIALPAIKDKNYQDIHISLKKNLKKLNLINY